MKYRWMNDAAGRACALRKLVALFFATIAPGTINAKRDSTTPPAAIPNASGGTPTGSSASFETELNSGVSPSNAVAPAARKGAASTAGMPISSPWMANSSSTCPMLAPRLRSSAISAACRSISSAATMAT